ncbi:methyltransferase domain-containing protein [Spongiactinospora sp. 9N601]|uniref:methyltransferase domain-containing protein n=1 Tax=Spongiactinospora sp. 9N601 TaxID=3375149 RepID=UPI0037967372
MTGTAGRIERMISDITALVGDIPGPVRAAFQAMPRHLFIPPVALVGGADMTAGIDRHADPAAWMNAVYSDMPIVTQLADGAVPIRDTISDDGSLRLPPAADYTSSNSAPATVADLLVLLDPAPGHRVLEVGTGTGWTAALLSHLVGEHNVTSIEVDPEVGGQAAKNLGEAGVTPYLIVGDGADGCPDRALYDRVHVTCGIRQVPYAWVEQSRPGGIIVAPWCPNFGGGHAVRLVVTLDGIAHGRFPRFASYMMMRSQRPATTPGDRRSEHTTTVDPRTIAAAPAGANLAMAAITGLGCYSYREDDTYRVVVTDPPTGNWSVATWRPGRDEYTVRQAGDRPLWEEAVDAYFRWVSWGEPGRDRFGMTVTPEGQQVWLDTPERPVTRP